MPKVVITGMGLWTPLGEGIISNWNGFSQPCLLPLGEGGRRPDEGHYPATSLAEAAAKEALQDAGLWDGERLTGVDPYRFGCTVSASKPLLTPAVVPPEVVNDFLRQRFGLEGECRNVIAACATGAYAIALAGSWIEEGLCDVVLAGSVEAYPHPLIEAGFRRMGVVTPESVMRPFDQRRSGFTFGAGAGIVVLESEKHFRQRDEYRISNIEKVPFRNTKSDIRPYAVLSGWGLGSDPHSAVAFNSNGRHIAGVIQRACRRGGIEPQAIRHVNAHGTATRHNDVIETQALQAAFGAHAGKLCISATKSHTGHLLGAAGSVELIFTVLALHHQFIPPTAHWKEPDPDCPLDYTPNVGHPERFDHALSLSFGFGGPIGALLVSSPS